MKRLLCALLITLSAAAHAENFAVVVNKSSAVGKLDKREVANIFLSKTTRHHNNQTVTPLELHDTATQELFYHEISGKTLAQINSYWTTLIFTGKGRPPKKISGVAQLIEALSKNPNAITYLPLNQITGSMKIVHMVD